MATKKAAPADYSESSIRVLKGLEPVKQRPGMYTRTDSPLHIVQEVIDNAAYEALAPEVRSKLDEVAAEWEAKMNKTMKDGDDGDMKILQDMPQIEMIQARPEDIEALRVKMDDYLDSWAKENGEAALGRWKKHA